MKSCRSAILSFQFSTKFSRQQLENLALMVQEAVDDSAAGEALGAAVACYYDPMAVEVIFATYGKSMAELHHYVAIVIAAIEPIMPLDFHIVTTARSVGKEEVSEQKNR